MTCLAALTQVYVDSSVTTSLTASVNTLYVVDTAAAAVTVSLPSGVAAGNWIVIVNAPANGPQMGGTAAGHNVTVRASGGETIEGSPGFTRRPPTSLVTAAASKFWPTGTGWAVE